MILQTVTLSVLAFTASVILYFIGNSFINLISGNSVFVKRNTFLSIYWGSLILVFITAIITTRGNTVFLLLIIPGVMLSKNLQSIPSISNRQLVQELSAIPILFFLFAILAQWMPYPWSIENDSIFYAKVSEGLFNNGIENGMHYFQNYMEVTPGNTPYHNFELWFTGLFGRIFTTSYSNLFLYKYFTGPLFLSYVIIGLSQLANSKPNKYIRITIITLSFFLLLINFSPLMNIGEPYWGLFHSPFERVNLIYYYYGLLPAFIYLINAKDYTSFTGYLLVLPILSVTMAPAIFTGIILFIVYLFIVRKTGLRPLSKQALWTVITAIAFFLFYTFTDTNDGYQASENPSLVETIKYSLSIWKGLLHVVLTFVLRSGLLLVMPIIILFIIRKKISITVFDALVFCILVTLSGIIIFQLVYSISNTYQFTYIGYVAYALMFIIAVLKLFDGLPKKYSYPLLSIVIIIVLVQVYPGLKPLKLNKSIEQNYLLRRNYSKETIENIGSRLDGSSATKAGFYINNENTLRPNHKHALTFQYGNDFSILKSNFNLYPLTPPEILYQDSINSDKYNRARSFNEQLTFYKNFDSENAVDYINNFIIQNNLEFIITDAPVEDLAAPVIILPPREE